MKNTTNNVRDFREEFEPGDIIKWSNAVSNNETYMVLNKTNVNGKVFCDMLLIFSSLGFKHHIVEKYEFKNRSWVSWHVLTKQNTNAR